MLGCLVIGYMSWVLATSSLNRFLSGTLVFIRKNLNTKHSLFDFGDVAQIFTYVVIALGFFLFINGLIGWVGTVSQSVWLVRLVRSVSAPCQWLECRVVPLAMYSTKERQHSTALLSIVDILLLLSPFSSSALQWFASWEKLAVSLPSTLSRSRSVARSSSSLANRS